MDAAVGVADEARESSHDGEETRTEGEAGLRYPSRSLRAFSGVSAR